MPLNHHHEKEEVKAEEAKNLEEKEHDSKAWKEVENTWCVDNAMGPSSWDYSRYTDYGEIDQYNAEIEDIFDDQDNKENTVVQDDLLHGPWPWWLGQDGF